MSRIEIVFIDERDLALLRQANQAANGLIESYANEAKFIANASFEAIAVMAKENAHLRARLL